MSIAYPSVGPVPAIAPIAPDPRPSPSAPPASARPGVTNRPPGAFPLAGRSPLRSNPMTFWSIPTVDPAAFFLPTDAHNERFEELSAHPDWSFYGSAFSREELLAQRNRVFARHPKTRFVAAHMGEQPEDLASLTAMLDAHPNVHLDMSARLAELGRQPFTARRFFLRFADRILFGADLLPEESMYRGHYRFFETDDEYFDYPSHASRQGRWQIYGLALPDAVLERVYRGNAMELLDMSQ